MPRDMQQLRAIADKLAKRVDTEHPGLGVVMFVFDSRGPNDRPVAIYLHGVDEPAAVRIMRESADLVERADQGDRIIKPPLLVKPN